LSQAAIPQVSICTVGTVNETWFFFHLPIMPWHYVFNGIMHIHILKRLRLLSAVLPTIIYA
jgi:hypothetical protein